MSQCELCGEEVSKVHNCIECGVVFCRECGSLSENLCVFCMPGEEEEWEDKEELEDKEDIS